MTPEDDELTAGFRSFATMLEEVIRAEIAKAIAPLEARVRELEYYELQHLLADDEE